MRFKSPASTPTELSHEFPAATTSISNRGNTDKRGYKSGFYPRSSVYDTAALVAPGDSEEEEKGESKADHVLNRAWGAGGWREADGIFELALKHKPRPIVWRLPRRILSQRILR